MAVARTKIKPHYSTLISYDFTLELTHDHVILLFYYNIM